NQVQGTTTTATQVIDVSSLNPGGHSFELSGLLGGYSTQGDYAQVTATFEDASGTAQIGPITEADRVAAADYLAYLASQYSSSAPAADSGLLPANSFGTLPPGTEKVLITVSATAISTGNDSRRARPEVRPDDRHARHHRQLPDDRPGNARAGRQPDREPRCRGLHLGHLVRRARRHPGPAAGLLDQLVRGARARGDRRVVCAVLVELPAGPHVEPGVLGRLEPRRRHRRREHQPHADDRLDRARSRRAAVQAVRPARRVRDPERQRGGDGDVPERGR